MKRMIQRISLLLMTAVWFTACISTPSEQAGDQTAPATITPQTLKDIDPRLQSFDSAQVLFYLDPFGGDPERYTRFYTQTPLAGPEQVQVLHQQLTAPFVQSDTLRECRSEGKIFLFEKGQIRQTIYFAGRPAMCKHAYIIHNGAYYYMPLLPETETTLEQWRKAAQ